MLYYTRINKKDFLLLFKHFISHLFCSNDSIKKRRNMPSIKNKRHDISFMARAHSEWHGVIWKPQISIFLKEADRRTLLLPILIITQCFHINVLGLSFFDNRFSRLHCSFANKTLLVSFWKLVSSSTTYGSWLSLYFDGIGSGAIWRGLCNYTSDESQQWVNLKF